MTRYLKYTIENIDPIRISDDSSSQSGQTITLRYIPGSSIRGYVIGQIMKNGQLDKIKKSLLSNKVRFMNAYLSVNGNELFPSPKGFYEDKSSAEVKHIENVTLNGDFSDGMKRASLGRYARFENDMIRYYQVKTESDLKIKINLEHNEKQNVFRNEFISKGQFFTGYIAVDDEELEEYIKDSIDDILLLGSVRSAGYGKCKVVNAQWTENIPYSEIVAQKDQTEETYLYLLSDTVMRNEYGELCGIDEKKLEELLGITELNMELCSTSIVNVRGYNRTWGTKLPSAVMYEKGSVFHLKYKGIISSEKMNELMNKGIGIRTNEGFGRVLFFDKSMYEPITKKMEGESYSSRNNNEKSVTETDRKVLRQIAKSYYKNQIRSAITSYIVSNDLRTKINIKNISNSQLGMIESSLIKNQYQPSEAQKVLEKYLSHAKEKAEKNNKQQHKNRADAFEKVFIEISSKSLDELLNIQTKSKNDVMGISKDELLSVDEINLIKISIMIDMIRYFNKEEA